MKFVLLLLLAVIAAVCGKVTNDVPPPFDVKIANQSVYLAAAVLCETTTFATRTYIGASAGFQYKATIRDEPTDTTGYVGLLGDKIYVVYRGTSSKTQWADDAEAWQDDPKYPDCKDCQIHHGFHKCIDNTFKSVLEAVQALRKEHPSYQIVCAGHSLGGALTNLAAISLSLAGITNVQHYSFGSPRVGNPAFAVYSDKVLPHAQRITHYKDTVPHTPPPYIPLVGKYQHIVSEVYEDKDHTLHACVGFEDPHCSMQWNGFETDPADHSLYLDVVTSCPDGDD